MPPSLIVRLAGTCGVIWFLFWFFFYKIDMVFETEIMVNRKYDEFTGELIAMPMRFTTPILFLLVSLVITYFLYLWFYE